MKLFRLVSLRLLVLAAGIAAASFGIHAQAPPTRIRIIYTNDTLGFLEACGWNHSKTGGLARRATAIRNLTQENPNRVLVESGNLSNIAVRLPAVMSVMAELCYDAIGVGEADLRANGDAYFGEAGKHKLTVLDAQASNPKKALPYVIKNVAGVRVGITSFGAHDPSEPSNEYVRRKAMYSTYKRARDESDILIVLDQANVVSADWLERNGKRLGQPDIVISGQAKVGLVKPEVIGRTHIVPTSFQAAKVGVLDVQVRSGETPTMDWRLVELNERVAEDEKTKSMMQEFIFRTTVPLSQQHVVLPPSTSAVATSVAAEIKPYYSPELCKPCHIRQYEDWSKTGHAKAIKTLIDENRVLPECLECHSEQYRRLQTATMPLDNLGGVDCATCHIDALPHTAERSRVASRTKVNAAICVSCHTKERSPKYDKVVYFPQVTHPSADSDRSATAALAKP